MYKFDRIDALGKTAFRGREFLWNLRGGGSVIRKGGDFGDVKNDTELKADKELGEFLAEQVVREFSEVGRVTVEGLGELPGNAGGQLWATIDPIDGSLNYKHCGRMNGFPFTSCITLLEDRGDKTSFADVVAASVVDLRREVRDIWVVDRSDSYVTRCGQVGESLWLGKTLEADVLHLGQMNVIAEMYYPENREKVFRAFSDVKGWLRSPGSAAYEMASVASGQAAAFICDRQKQHELGAGYALVKGAGGVAVDWDGQDLGSRVYDFKTQTPVILAANRQIADQLLELLNRS